MVASSGRSALQTWRGLEQTSSSSRFHLSLWEWCVPEIVLLEKRSLKKGISAVSDFHSHPQSLGHDQQQAQRGRLWWRIVKVLLPGQLLFIPSLQWVSPWLRGSRLCPPNVSREAWPPVANPALHVLSQIPRCTIRARRVGVWATSSQHCHWRPVPPSHGFEPFWCVHAGRLEMEWGPKLCFSLDPPWQPAKTQSSNVAVCNSGSGEIRLRLLGLWKWSCTVSKHKKQSYWIMLVDVHRNPGWRTVPRSCYCCDRAAVVHVHAPQSLWQRGRGRLFFDWGVSERWTRWSRPGWPHWPCLTWVDWCRGCRGGRRWRCAPWVRRRGVVHSWLFRSSSIFWSRRRPLVCIWFVQCARGFQYRFRFRFRRSRSRWRFPTGTWQWLAVHSKMGSFLSPTAAFGGLSTVSIPYLWQLPLTNSCPLSVSWPCACGKPLLCSWHCARLSECPCPTNSRLQIVTGFSANALLAFVPESILQTVTQVEHMFWAWSWNMVWYACQLSHLIGYSSTPSWSNAHAHHGDSWGRSGPVFSRTCSRWTLALPRTCCTGRSAAPLDLLWTLRWNLTCDLFRFSVSNDLVSDCWYQGKNGGFSWTINRAWPSSQIQDAKAATTNVSIGPFDVHRVAKRLVEDRHEANEATTGSFSVNSKSHTWLFSHICKCHMCCMFMVQVLVVRVLKPFPSMSHERPLLIPRFTSPSVITCTSSVTSPAPLTSLSDSTATIPDNNEEKKGGFCKSKPLTCSVSCQVPVITLYDTEHGVQHAASLILM